MIAGRFDGEECARDLELLAKRHARVGLWFAAVLRDCADEIVVADGGEQARRKVIAQVLAVSLPPMCDGGA